jgi:hypothetical protein
MILISCQAGNGSVYLAKITIAVNALAWMGASPTPPMPRKTLSSGYNPG